MEECKKTLSQVESATIFFSDFLENEDGDPVDDLVVSRTTFDSLIAPLIKRTIDLIEDLLAKTSIPMDTIDNILLVGGSSCIPLVKSMLSEKYGADNASTESVIATLDQCEFARYSSMNDDSDMATVYNEACELINKIENVKKK